MTPQELLERLNDDNQTLQYALKQILKRNFTVLPDTIANGKVLKIHYEGDLNSEEGYEKGFLVLTPNSGIKTHKHTNDIEMYTLLLGTLSVDGIKCDNNICLIDEEHGIDCVDEITIIKTLKLSEKKIKSKRRILRKFTKIFV